MRSLYVRDVDLLMGNFLITLVAIGFVSLAQSFRVDMNHA
jgi:hypothetical protein